MIRSLLVFACAVCSLGLFAQEFEEPQRVMAGDSFVGHELEDRNRLYPSPGLHDIDGDGNIEMVIGDLFGRLTYVSRTKDGWSEEKILTDVDGNPLKFKNW